MNRQMQDKSKKYAQHKLINLPVNVKSSASVFKEPTHNINICCFFIWGRLIRRND